MQLQEPTPPLSSTSPPLQELHLHLRLNRFHSTPATTPPSLPHTTPAPPSPLPPATPHPPHPASPADMSLPHSSSRRLKYTAAPLLHTTLPLLLRQPHPLRGTTPRGWGQGDSSTRLRRWQGRGFTDSEGTSNRGTSEESLNKDLLHCCSFNAKTHMEQYLVKH